MKSTATFHSQNLHFVEIVEDFVNPKTKLLIVPLEAGENYKKPAP